MPASLKTLTLGCKVNQYETEHVRQALMGIGYQDAADRQSADLCLVNTCTVTAEGDSKSRQAIRRLHRENPGARIVVMGCYATRAPEEVAKLPGVSELILDKRELPDWLGRNGVRDVPDGLTSFSNRHRAFLKIQDGCALRCTYCIIPYVRPHLSSRPVDHILDEIRRLTDSGFREIIFTGIHLGHYGLDWNRLKPASEWIQLADLLERVVKLPGNFRVRLSSIEATEVPRRLIEVVADHPERIAPHFHLCLQSGSDSVLRRMRRRWSTKMFLDRCDLIRENMHKPAITTDVIVGFPGETDEDFESTIRTCRSAQFSKMHIFSFSPRKGTEAATYPDQIDPEVKYQRVERLRDVERELQSDYGRSLIGETVKVLVETPNSYDSSQQQVWQGTTCRYTPLRFEAAGNREFELLTCKITGVSRLPNGDCQLIGALR